MATLASDPLGNGANYFGTSAYKIDYTIISYAAIWYVQVAALISGHVGGLALAHDRALSIYPNSGTGDSLAVLDARRDGGVHELRVCGCFRRWGRERRSRVADVC